MYIHVFNEIIFSPSILNISNPEIVSKGMINGVLPAAAIVKKINAINSNLEWLFKRLLK